MTRSGARERFDIRPAEPGDVPELIALVRELAEYERLSHLVECTEHRLHQALFGEQPSVEALLARELGGAVAGFALYFHNYSTFLGLRGDKPANEVRVEVPVKQTATKAAAGTRRAPAPRKR